MPYTLQISQHLVVPEPQHPVSVALEPQCSLRIRDTNVRLIVLPAIHLDNQPPFEADEVHDVGSNRLLPPEFQPVHPFAPQMGPQDSLCIGLSPP